MWRLPNTLRAIIFIAALLSSSGASAVETAYFTAKLIGEKLLIIDINYSKPEEFRVIPADDSRVVTISASNVKLEGSISNTSTKFIRKIVVLDSPNGSRLVVNTKQPMDVSYVTYSNKILIKIRQREALDNLEHIASSDDAKYVPQQCLDPACVGITNVSQFLHMLGWLVDSSDIYNNTDSQGSDRCAGLDQLVRELTEKLVQTREQCRSK